ncbi:MAG: alpha/beta hydrolase [Proteobacteria bacterium]|nr:alpha/beta hydrolase [Pseudomonadota bacterium]
MARTPPGELTLKKVRENPAAQIDIVFVHGLKGCPEATWTCSGDGEVEGKFWPEWLATDIPPASVFSLGYPASFFKQPTKPEMNIYERAKSALDYMISMGIGSRPIIFITHSMGGLLVKQIMRIAAQATENKAWQSFSKNTSLVVFIATPHTGASLAEIADFLFSKSGSTHIALLSNNSGFLGDLNEAYKAFTKDKCKTVTYYEKFKTKGFALVVTPESANPEVGDPPIPVDADHEGICKPSSRISPLYSGIKLHVQKLLQELKPSTLFDVEDYGQKEESDRRNLLQKLIDANKEHEYPRANNMQNKFAMKYQREGLLTEAKAANDRLLSDVLQRFLVHVYHAKISKNAPEDEVTKALQHDVIDAIRKEDKTISPTAILQALYFLADQCYISWDKPK